MNPTSALKPLLFLLLLSLSGRLYAGTRPVIYTGARPSAKVQLAAKEVRRYVYIATGALPGIRTWKQGMRAPAISVFLVASPDQFRALPVGLSLPAAARTLGTEGYWVKTVRHAGKTVHIIAGGSDTGVLYGAFAFAECFGVRFYLDGDVVPSGIDVESIAVEEKTGKPLFSIRGIQPFHDFPEGPDWWTRDDYKAVLSQLLRLKMNFVGLHTYPEGGIGPEPLVWIGRKEDIGADGSVNAAYPARHFTNVNGTWGYAKRLTSAYSNRLGDLFDNDAYGTSYMKGMNGWPAGAGGEKALFDSSAAFFSDVFTYARDLGIRTCVGTETPLVVPARVRERLAATGVAASDTTQVLYEGMFEWVKRHYPVDYYWFWTPEDWTWRENTPEELRKTASDLESAIRAAGRVNAPFTLATCGWVLGPSSDRSYFDRILPKTWPMSCINRYVGFEPIEEGFTRSAGRPLWAIPWMEDDPALSQPQLWAGRMRRDALDAAAYGCTGLIGIHWRTRILGPNIAALASAAWDQPWNPNLGVKSTPEAAAERKKTMNLDFPVGDFYRDWAKRNFGGDSSDAIASIFNRLDGGPLFRPAAGLRTWMPRPADWIDGPGGIKADTLVWEKRSADYLFVDTLESLGETISAPGARERFGYWLGMFRYLRSAGKFSCTLGEIQRLAEKASKDSTGGRSAYWERFVSLRKRQILELDEVLTHLVETVSTKGELGTIANWEQHIRELSLEKPAARIENLMGRSLPDECRPSGRLLDVKRMIVPTVRNTLRRG
ncbi:MAG TPA: alpha-glucuronidase family glycosyl hydrolase, partial [Bacteroidota bacterium]|nr:alpha-glucuronidase family glycosyl hydrolase [Bacteroidota bacterium]